MRDERGDVASSDTATYLISVAAELAGMHAQTLRTYDRLGLVTPQRTTGGGRRYSPSDVERLREIQRLSQDEGVNLAGIKRIIELSDELEELQRRVAELSARAQASRGSRGEVVHVERSNSVVVWQPRRRRSE
ncbi:MULTISPECIES: heat shock protein transcriptional repressor HspR [unclassified Gordonia (in: high G+C Gram-positive bacteria)]|uniref:heat shock protein transcriptional repressor HspR n=1 Tax=unclassified Gordonia (in: high G+C Gram-positive bacteria) TaxID=2657482 RepID=UPI001FFF448E|nr:MULTISPECIES: helix-turn-helix transcriptional regulator [unclassified Gordonia (in: high G+C Gram-positive bacteria)]UQE75444.1 helix-turn-helix transcriptional regulator [Gordonia sp. PP30]